MAARGDVIEVVSENTGEVLGRSPADLVGTSLTRLLGTEQRDGVEGLLDADTGATAMLPVVVTSPDGPRLFDLTVHRADGLLVAEFEPAGSGDRLSFARFYAPVRQALVRLQAAPSVRAACQAAVREVRAVTGYDRVVAYRFESADGRVRWWPTTSRTAGSRGWACGSRRRTSRRRPACRTSATGSG